MDPARVQSAVVGQIGAMIGREGAEQVATIIANASGPRSTGFMSPWLGLAILAFGATSAFAQLQFALNRIWSVKPDPRRNLFWLFLVKRVFSFGIGITIAFFLLVSLVVSAALSAIGNYFAGGLVILTLGLEAVTSLAALVLTTLLFAVMFRYLPDARIAWRDVWAGAVGSAFLFVLGKSAIGLYLGGSSDPADVYGAAGSLAIAMIWVYYTSMIVLLGAEFTVAWARTYGRGIKPEPGAIAYVEEERLVKTGVHLRDLGKTDTTGVTTDQVDPPPPAADPITEPPRS